MMRFSRTIALLTFLSLTLLLLPSPSGAWVRGVYDVGSESPDLLGQGIEAVFVQPSTGLITSYNKDGKNVFLTLNAFGGADGWKEFADSRPIKANGELLEVALGGICPTHEGWRRSRLELLASWVKNYRGEAALAGIWLDFLRYPGRWEQIHPEIPDTCYCPRCLAKFQKDAKLRIDDKAVTTADQAAWIKANGLPAWSAWQKEQIVSFAREARQVIEQGAEGRKILLGAFLVPWRKSDRDGAISLHLAQDIKTLTPFIDVFSPMVYHRMVGQDPAWVRELSDYFAGMTSREVWPIIQAEEVCGEEFGQAVRMVEQSSAQGGLVYQHNTLTKEHWPQLKQSQGRINLLENSRLLPGPGQSVSAATGKGERLPQGWFPALKQEVRDSTFSLLEEEGGNVLGLTAGHDRKAYWRSGLPPCQPGASYLFSGEFYRPDRADSLAYPEISLWGRSYFLNTHRMTDRFQKLHAIVTCPEESRPEELQFFFRNNYPGNTFLLRNPSLVEKAPEPAAEVRPPAADFYPIGIYGASAKNLTEIQKIGFSTAVIGLSEENLDACLALGMRCTFAVPHSAEKLLHTLEMLGPKLRQGRFMFYVNDEPEIHSVPAGEAEDIQRILKQRFPEAPTNMAIVRPQGIPFYARSADYFMLDQYPVPNMPMAWLADSMDEAAGYVGRGRLQSVIQAFGDDKHAAGGWPRLPTLAEMRCLALLSVIHGSRGIYFFTYPSITASESGKNDITRLVRELNSLRPWLQVENATTQVTLRMSSAHRFDPKGNPAVHCARKERHSTQMLLCVNTLATHSEAEIDIPADRQKTWTDFFNGKPYMVVDGNLLARFEPYEAKVLLETR